MPFCECLKSFKNELKGVHEKKSKAIVHSHLCPTQEETNTIKVEVPSAPHNSNYSSNNNTNNNTVAPDINADSPLDATKLPTPKVPAQTPPYTLGQDDLQRHASHTDITPAHGESLNVSSKGLWADAYRMLHEKELELADTYGKGLLAQQGIPHQNPHWSLVEHECCSPHLSHPAGRIEEIPSTHALFNIRPISRSC